MKLFAAVLLLDATFKSEYSTVGVGIGYKF